ncbi:MAG: nucleotidyltransferase family protein [Bacteroidaceae bacterium]|nr:nucleotidyltransferase family protein [Bacteroidaceae bacterium]
MTKSQELLFELLLVSTGARKMLSHGYTDQEWEEAYNLAEEQTIAGVLLSGMEILQQNVNFNANLNEGRSFFPSKMLLLQWIGNCQIIEAETKKLESAAETVVKYFHKNGFACQILKGCSVGRYYPNPLRRSSGDIDVWLDGSRKKIYDFARAFDKDGKLYGVNYHHIHFHLIDGVHIEAHIWPSYLSSPLRNCRLHKFCNSHRPTMEATTPSLAFDRVFILLHCYRHICGHGVGLRQIMDYYYILKQGFTEEEGRDAIYWIKQLGMGRFAAGLMWVLKVYFGLEEQYLLMEPDEKEGRFIIKEVMLTGNMGHSDTRNWGSLKSPLSRFFLNLRRDFYLVKHYPHEAIWQPLFSIWLYLWRFSKVL